MNMHMTDKNTSTPDPKNNPADRLFHRLGALGGRRKRFGMVRGLFLGAVLAAGVAVFLAWMDMLVVLTSGQRALGLAAIYLFGLALLIKIVVGAWRGARESRVARDVDHVSETGGQVAAGAELGDRPDSEEPIVLGLTGMAIRAAEKLAAKTPGGKFEPFGRVMYPFLGVLGAALAISILCAIFPGPARLEWLRFSDPYGDHPPYSRYTFTVEPGNAEILSGDSLDIHATIEGPPAEQLDLMVRNQDQTEDRVPMFQDMSGGWRAQLTGVDTPLMYWVSLGRARSERYNVSVITTPQIRKFETRIDPPAYANLPPYEGPVPKEGIAGLRGTKARVTLRSNRPLSRGSMRFIPEKGEARTVEVTPLPNDSHSVSWDMEVSESGHIALRIWDVDGQPSTAEASCAVTLVKDQRPFVRILSPKARSFATPDIVLPVKMEAEDDCGVAELRLYRALNGSRHLPDTLDTSNPPPRRIDATSNLLLKDYGLSPGDSITLFARATDNDPFDPKGSESTSISLTIVSRETYEQWLRDARTAKDFQQRYMAARRRMEKLTTEMEKLREDLAKRELPNEELRERIKELQKAMAEAAEATRKSAEEKPLFALDEDLAEPLRELAERMDSAAKELETMRPNADADAMELALARAEEALGEGRQKFEEDLGEALDRFMAAVELLQMQNRFLELVEAQKDLARRADDLRGRDRPDDPALRVRMRDLEEEQRQLSGDLTSILDEIERLAEALPQDMEYDNLRKTACDFAAAVKESRALPAMKEGTEGLKEMMGSVGAERSAEAARVLEGFIQECCNSGQQLGEQACKAFGPTRSKQTRETLGQLLGRGAGAFGLGSGKNGYSMRQPGVRNVGVYGSAPLPEASGMSADGREYDTPGFSTRTEGGTAEGDVPPPERADMTLDAIDLNRVPPEHREAVRAYFKRVADELSTGVMLKDPTESEGEKP